MFLFLALLAFVLVSCVDIVSANASKRSVMGSDVHASFLVCWFIKGTWILGTRSLDYLHLHYV